MTQKEIDKLRTGDVVLRHNKNGSVSTRGRARRVAARGNARCREPHTFTLYYFVKQLRSRYPAPYTIIYPHELLDRQYTATGRRVSLTSRIDRRIARAITDQSVSPYKHITQNEVVGVVS